MKKRIFFLSTVALVLCTFATVSAQPKYIVKAGLNLANVSGDVEGNKILPTFLVGARAEFGLAGNLDLGVGLELAGKGSKFEESILSANVNPMYIQVPIQLIYRNNGLFAGVGPYIGFGVAGNVKAGEEKEKIKFGSGEDDDFSAIDYGAGLEVGFEFSILRITASYNLGLANVIPSDFADLSGESAKHNVIGIALAVILGGD